MKMKPALSFWQFWNLSFGFLGIQFGFGIQNANVSRIFEALGARVDDIPILWIAAPTAGLIIQPIITRRRDQLRNRSIRRLSYFFSGAIMASLALLFMPNSPAIWAAAGLLWILAASIHIYSETYHTFVGWLPGEHRIAGFDFQYFFIFAGSAIASALPWVFTNWLDVSNVVVAGERIPQSVKLSFYFGAVFCILAVLWTVFCTKEYPSDDHAEFEAEKNQTLTTTEATYKSSAKLLPSFIRNGFIFLISGIFGSLLIQQMGWEKELYVLSASLGAFGMIFLISAWCTRQGLVHNGFVEVITDLMNMPKTMKQLAIVQFFSWFALFSLWIYSTSAVTSHTYGTSDTASALYNEGANWVGVLFATYNVFAAVVAFLLPVLARWISRKTTHAIALVCGGIGLASFYVVEDPHILIISMLGVGFAWASILLMPYAILTESLPALKMRTYMGIFNYSIFIPQILAASVLGVLTKILFQGHSIYALILGGVSLMVAAMFMLFVDTDVQKYRTVLKKV